MNIALYPGAFKPPHKGHYEVVKTLLDGSYKGRTYSLEDYKEVGIEALRNPQSGKEKIDQVYVLVSNLTRKGQTAEDSRKIWELYTKAFGDKVKIMDGGSNPMDTAKDLARADTENNFFAIAGIRSDEDVKDLRRISTFRSIPHVKGLVLTTAEEQSSRATDLRKALLDNNLEKVKTFLPPEISSEDTSKVLSILMKNQATPENLEEALYQSIGQTLDLMFSTSKPQESIQETKVNFKELEEKLDKLFSSLDIDVEFTKHFKDRVVERGLSEEDIMELMRKVYDRHGKQVDGLDKGESRVFTDLTNLVDIAASMGGYGEDYLRDLNLVTAYKSVEDERLRTNKTSPRLTVKEGSSTEPFDRLEYYRTYYANLSPSTFNVECDGDAIKISNITAQEETLHPHKDAMIVVIGELLEYMIDQKLSILPIPEVKFVDDQDNSRDLFGKTAYYDPNSKEIVLFTTGRHGKDILRSFCHEMIHHIQNLEGRLPFIQTTNVNQDGDLAKIEEEAYRKGNMIFRSYENQRKEKEPLMEGRYDSMTARISREIFNCWKRGFDKDPKTPHVIYTEMYELEDRKGITLDFQLYAMIKFKKTKDQTYSVDGGANHGDEHTPGTVFVTFTIDPRRLPEEWSEMSMDIKDVVRHEIEHLTQGGYDVRPGKKMRGDLAMRQKIKDEELPKWRYMTLRKEVDAMLQGLYYRAKKEKKPFPEVIDRYLTIQGFDDKDKERVLKVWRKRAAELSLPKL